MDSQSVYPLLEKIILNKILLIKSIKQENYSQSESYYKAIYDLEQELKRVKDFNKIDNE